MLKTPIFHSNCNYILGCKVGVIFEAAIALHYNNTNTANEYVSNNTKILLWCSLVLPRETYKQSPSSLCQMGGQNVLIVGGFLRDAQDLTWSMFLQERTWHDISMQK